MSEASLAGVSAVKRLGVWGAILWPVKEWFLTTTQLKDWRTTTIQTEPALMGWDRFFESLFPSVLIYADKFSPSSK